MELAPKYTFDDINAEMQFCLMPEKLCVASHQDGFFGANSIPAVYNR